MTSHCITWHDTTQAITSHQMTWPSHDLTPQQTSRHQKTSLQSTKHHHHGTAEGSFTAKKWFGHRAGRSPCAHSIGKFFLCYIVLFLLETSAPGLSGHYWYFIPIRILQYTSLQGIGHWNPSLITSAAERRYHLWFGDCNQDAAAILHQCAVSKLDQPTEKTWLVHKRRALRMLQARLYKLSIWIEIRENANESHTSLQRSPIASTRMPVSWQTEALQDSVWWPETIYSNLQYTIGAISCIQSPFTAVPFLTASSRLIISPCPYQILSLHDNWSNFEILLIRTQTSPATVLKCIELSVPRPGTTRPGQRFRVPFLEWSQSWLISPHDFAGLFPVWGLIYTVKHRKPCDVLRHDLQSGILTTEHEQHEMCRRTHTQWPWNSVLNLHQTIKLAPRNHVIKYHSMRQLKLAVSLGSPPPRSARWLLGWLAAFGAKERLPRPPGAWDLEPQFWGTAKVLILILMASVHRDLVWNLCLGPLGWVEHPSTKWRSLWWTWWKSLWLWSPSACLCWAGLGKVEASRPSPVAQEAPLLPSQSHRGMEVLLHPRGGPNKRLYMISTPPWYCKHSCPPPAASLWPDKLGPHSVVWCSCTKPRRKPDPLLRSSHCRHSGIRPLAWNNSSQSLGTSPCLWSTRLRPHQCATWDAFRQSYPTGRLMASNIHSANPWLPSLDHPTRGASPIHRKSSDQCQGCNLWVCSPWTPIAELGTLCLMLLEGPVLLEASQPWNFHQADLDKRSRNQWSRTRNKLLWLSAR